METYEYEISVHDSSEFSNIIYFCNEKAECSGDALTNEQQMLSRLFNERGVEGWELVQLVFGKDNIMAFWKRKHLSQERKSE